MVSVLPQPHLCFVESDLNEPSAELGFLAKAGKILECLEYGVLRNILSISPILYQGNGGPKD